MTNLVEVTVRINDSEANVDLGALEARLRALGGQTVRVNMKVDGAGKAVAEAGATSEAIKKIDDNSRGTFRRVSVGFLSWLNPIKRATWAISGAGGMTPGLLRLAFAAPEVTAVVVAALAAIAAACAPVVAAIIPISIGFAGLAAVALPELKKLFAAVSGGHKAMKGLDDQEKSIVFTMRDLKSQFADVAKAVRPAVLLAFGEGLQVLKDLMPALKPLIRAAANAVAYFLAQMDAWLRSPSGQAFIHWLRTQGPRDIHAFAVVAWDMARSIGQAFNALYRSGIWIQNYFGHKFVPNVREAFWNLYQWIYHDFVQRIQRFFTSTIPTAFDIWKEKVRIVWDDIKMNFLHGVLYITTTMGHLPGPLGAPFRKASASIRNDLHQIQADVRNAADNINRDWQHLHGRDVTIKFGLGLPAGVHLSPSAQGQYVRAQHYASGTGGAAPGWGMVGEQGTELVNFKGGEQVIPHGQSMQLLRGYAGGTGFDFRDVIRPRVGSFIHTLNAYFSQTENLLASWGQKHIAPVIAPTAGIGGGVQRWAGLVALVLRMLGQPAGDIGTVLAQMTTESGGYQYAINLTDINARMGDPSRGLMQVILSNFLAYAGPFRSRGIYDPLANIFAGVNYAIHRYGSAWTSVLGHGHGYAGGGPISEDIWGYGRSGTRYRFHKGERVEPGQVSPVVVLHLPSTGNAFDRFMVSWLQKNVRTLGGGDVQVAFGGRS